MHMQIAVRGIGGTNVAIQALCSARLAFLILVFMKSILLLWARVWCCYAQGSPYDRASLRGIAHIQIFHPILDMRFKPQRPRYLPRPTTKGNTSRSLKASIGGDSHLGHNQLASYSIRGSSSRRKRQGEQKRFIYPISDDFVISSTIYSSFSPCRYPISWLTHLIAPNSCAR